MTSHAIRDSSSLRYIGGLDGLRAISMMLVTAFHYTSYFSQQISQFGLPWSVLAHFASVGWVGVDVFFVISGFLITRTLKNRAVNSIDSYANFIRRRAFRLLPSYVVCLIGFSAIVLLIDSHSKVLINSYLLWTMTENIQTLYGDRSALADQHFAMVHFWSLALEWQFYLIFPILVACLRSFLKVAFGLVIIAILCRLAFHMLGISDNAIYSFTLCRMDSLAIGCALAAVPVDRWKKYGNCAGILGVAVLASLLVITTWSTGSFKLIIWLQLIGYTIIALSVAMIIFCVINASSRSKIKRFLEFGPLTGIGRASYSLYIWHLPVYPTIALTANVYFDDPRIAFIVAVTAGALVTATLGGLSYRFVEQPFMQIRHSITA